VKFGTAATFAKNQEFSTVHADTAADTIAGTPTTIGELFTQLDAGSFAGTSDGETFTDGTITATFTDIGAGEDSVQTYLFTDGNTNNTIDAGELTDPNGEFSTVTFGGGATVVLEQHIDHDFSAEDMNFKQGTTFHAGETFGEHVDFEGAITFPDELDMPTGAEFAAQTFTVGATPDFDNFSTFATGTTFDDTTIDFENNAHFEGTTTFANGSTHTFGDGTVFEGAVTLDAATTITYGDSVDFGPSTDLTAAIQDFTTNTTIPQFGTGTTFADNQVLPTGTVLSTGILLNGFTCDTDGALGTTCLTTVDADILTEGEMITPGETAPPAIKNTISADDTTVSIDGLGVSVDFTSITTDGNLSVSIQDPDVTVAATGAVLAADNSGALEFNASGTAITTVSSVIDFDLTGTTATSGSMNITLPYDEAAATAAGFSEESLKVSHFVNGSWVVENNCTVDTVNDEITCTVDTVE